jgi:folate-binding protein YgfZ
MPPRYATTEDYVCLEARGPAAGAFLHGQLSQTIEPLPQDFAPLAGWHDARGRVRALFRVVRLGDRFVLVTARDGAEQVLKRLRMFVLRAAVTLDFAVDLTLGAVMGAEGIWLEGRGLPAAAAPGTCRTVGPLTWIAIGTGYWQVLGPAEDLAALAAELPQAEPGAVAVAEIELGLPLITAGLVDRFVGQMLNLDALGALAFDKGCYPGQEIVARVHHLSDVKRRARRFAAPTATPLETGTTVATASGAGVGEVIRSAPAAPGVEVLAIIDNAAASVPLTAGGAALRELPLPFALPS